MKCVGFFSEIFEGGWRITQIWVHLPTTESPDAPKFPHLSRTS